MTNGVTRNGEPTPMTAWGEMINPGQRWKVLAYIFNTFTGGRKDLGTIGEGAAKGEKKIWQPWPFGSYPFGKDMGEEPSSVTSDK